MQTILVTGGSGKAGRAAVRDLLDHGYNVINLDIAPDPNKACKQVRVDLNDLGAVTEAMSEADAVVHLAAMLGGHTEQTIFHTNAMSTYNVFRAAAVLGMKRVVWASSETVLGLPFDVVKPPVAPVDESHCHYPAGSYSLSKVVGESMSEQFARWTGGVFVGLRFSNIMEPHDYPRFETWQDNPMIRKWNLWGYVDSRDVAQACRLGLTADVTGAPNYIIAAGDTCMRRTNADLLAQVFPDTKLREGVGDHETLLSIDKARRELGYEPAISWREQ